MSTPISPSTPDTSPDTLNAPIVGSPSTPEISPNALNVPRVESPSTPETSSETLEFQVVKRFHALDNTIGVLISPSYGVGWSTGIAFGIQKNRRLLKEIALFDSDIVDAIQRQRIEEAKDIVKRKFEACGRVVDSWILKTVETLEVHWLDEDTKFFVHEYDREEDIWFPEDIPWKTASSEAMSFCVER